MMRSVLCGGDMCAGVVNDVMCVIIWVGLM